MSTASTFSFYLSLQATNSTNRKMDVANFKEMMQAYLQDYQFALADGDTRNEATVTWDFYQDMLECCGLEGPIDWIPVRAKYLNNPNQVHHVLPLTCCWYETNPDLLKQSKSLCPWRHFPSVKGCLTAYNQVTIYRYVVLVICNYVPLSLDLVAALILLLTRHETQSSLLVKCNGANSNNNGTNGNTTNNSKKRHNAPSSDKQQHLLAAASKRK